MIGRNIIFRGEKREGWDDMLLFEVSRGRKSPCSGLALYSGSHSAGEGRNLQSPALSQLGAGDLQTSQHELLVSTDREHHCR